MPVTRAQVRNELRNDGFDVLFTDKHLDFLLDCKDVGYFLGNGPTTMANGLARLEARLLDRLSSVDLSFSESVAVTFGKKSREQVVTGHAQAYFQGWKERQGQGKKEESAYAHLLTRELGEREKAYGFNLLPGGKVKVYYDVLPADVFLRENAEAMHWKDLIDPRHGEFTHRIQWYLVMREIQPRVGTTKMFAMINGIPGLWDYLFDRAPLGSGRTPAAVDANDFRSPEHFNDYLTGGTAAAQYPLLTSFLTARKQKRENTFEKHEYLARKLFKKPLDKLSNKQEEQLQQRVKDMGGVYRP